MNRKAEQQLEAACLRDLFTNLNAIHIPHPEGKEAFYDSISPVNTFRLIFDTYFGSDLGFLDDRSFFTTMLNQEEADMSFIEVTGKQESCSPKWEKRFLDLQQTQED